MPSFDDVRRRGSGAVLQRKACELRAYSRFEPVMVFDEASPQHAKHGHRVRFLRNAYYTLARFAEPAADGTIHLAVQGRSIPLTAAAG